MNILMPIYSCNPEGESEGLVGYNWLSQISKQHKVFLITAAKYRPALEKRLNGNVVPYYVKVPEFGNLEILSGIAPGYFVFIMKAFFAAKKIIQDQRIDLIHRVTPIAFRFPDVLVNFKIPCLIGPVGGGLKPLASFPSVFKKESPVYWLRNLDTVRFNCDPWLIKTYTQARQVLIIGQYLYDVIPQKFRSKLRIFCEAAIDTRAYRFQSIRKNDVLKILYVGRFIPLKGVNLLIQALARLKKESPDIRFSATFIGDGGDYFAYCKNLATELGLKEHIHFAGRLNRVEIIKYYQEFDIFCFPSLKDSSGNVLLEAMSCGIPVIAADRGGPAEIVEENCGIKIPVNDENDFIGEFKEAILRLAKDPALRERYSLNARRLMEDKYEVNTIGERVTALYEHILRRTQQKN